MSQIHITVDGKQYKADYDVGIYEFEESGALSVSLDNVVVHDADGNKVDDLEVLWRVEEEVIDYIKDNVGVQDEPWEDD